MSSIFVMGSPGSGKSYFTVKEYIIENLKQGRKVIGNIPLNIEYLRELIGDNADLYEYRNPLDYPKSVTYKKRVDGELKSFTVEVSAPFAHEADFLSEEWRSDSGQCPVYVVDECQEIFSREAKPSHELLNFVSKHRHYGEMDIILISQGIGPIHARIKMCVERLVRLRKLGFMGDHNKFLRQEHEGSSTRGKPFIDKKETYDQNIFKVYKSHTESEKELTDIKRFKGSSSNKWFIRISILLVVVALLFVYKSGKTFLTEGVVKSSNSSAPVAPTPQTSVNSNNSTNPNITNAPEVITQKKVNDFDNINRHPTLEKKELVDSHEEVQRAVFFNHRFSIAAYIKSEKTKKELMTFNIDNKSTSMRTFQNSNELLKMGYKITIVNDCLALIDHEYEENPFYAYCEHDIMKSKTRAVTVAKDQ